MEQLIQWRFMAKCNGGIQIVAVLLYLYISIQSSGVSFAQAFDLMLTRRLTSDVILDQDIGVSNKCYCRASCVVKPACTAVTHFINEDGKIGCLYSETTHLNWTHSTHDITAVTFLKPGVLETALAPEQQELTHSYYLAANSTGCGPPFFIVDGVSGCMFLARERRTFADASSLCTSINSQLYVAPSPGEFLALRNYVLGIIPRNDIWVAVKERKWTDGRVVDTREWALGGSSGAPTECARMRSAVNFFLDDRACTFTFTFLCQRGV